MKKKFILVLTFAVTFCLLFTGCGKEIKKADEKGAGKSREISCQSNEES